jgi:hypothetical protein
MLKESYRPFDNVPISKKSGGIDEGGGAYGSCGGNFVLAYHVGLNEFFRRLSHSYMRDVDHLPIKMLFAARVIDDINRNETRLRILGHSAIRVDRTFLVDSWGDDVVVIKKKLKKKKKIRIGEEPLPPPLSCLLETRIGGIY